MRLRLAVVTNQFFLFGGADHIKMRAVNEPQAPNDDDPDDDDDAEPADADDDYDDD